jgi:hypothetical protein
VAGEFQKPRLLVHPEDRDVVTALIAGVEEAAGGIKVKTARVIAARWLVGNKGQFTILPMAKIAMLSCRRLPA